MKKKIYSIVQGVVLLGALVFVVGCSPEQQQNVPETQNANVNEQVSESRNTSQDTNQNTNTATEEEIDTSDWQTYTNEEYGFSFKYPKDWAYYTDITKEGYIYDEANVEEINFTESKNIGFEGGIQVISVNYNPKTQNVSVSVVDWGENTSSMYRKIADIMEQTITYE